VDKDFTYSSPLNTRKFRLSYEHDDPGFEERQMVRVRCVKCPRWGGTLTHVREMKSVYEAHAELRHG